MRVFKGTLGPLLLSLVAGALLIHPTYPPLFRAFQASRIRINRLLHRPIAYAYWDEKAGLPLVHYGKVYGADYGTRFNPLIACQWALEKILPHDTARFVEVALRIRQKLPPDLYWRSDFALPGYGFREGWTSAFTQALLAETFARAGVYRAIPDLIEDARRALEPLRVPVSQGGTALPLPDTGTWFLEYAYPPGPYPRVLNGMTWVLLSLHTLDSLLQDTLVHRLFQEGEAALRRCLTLYDLHGWSTYDLLGHPASETYQLMHLQLLEKMAHITGHPRYRRWKRRWALGLHNPVHARIAWGIYVLEVLVLWGLFSLAFRGVRRFPGTGKMPDINGP